MSRLIARAPRPLRRVRIGVGALLALWCAQTCAADAPAWLDQKLLEAAKPEGTLVIYSAINEQEGLPTWQLFGASIDFWPLEPIGLFFHEIGASAKAPHPNAARLAVNFMLSREGQRKTTTWGRLPVRRDVETNPPGVLDAFRGKTVIPITLAGEAEKKADALYKELVAGRVR